MRVRWSKNSRLWSCEIGDTPNISSVIIPSMADQIARAANGSGHSAKISVHNTAKVSPTGVIRPGYSDRPVINAIRTSVLLQSLSLLAKTRARSVGLLWPLDKIRVRCSVSAARISAMARSNIPAKRACLVGKWYKTPPLLIPA